jgi:hypothetical protein
MARTPAERPDARPSGAIRPKLRIGDVNDPLEREADRVADAVVANAPLPPVSAATPRPQAKCSECAKEDEQTLRRDAAGPAAAHAPAIAQDALLSPGQPLDGGTRAYFEPRFGTPLGHLRLHTGRTADQAAAAMGARAFTLNDDICFAAGEYSPGTRRGRALLAHEIAHTLQTGATPAIRRKLRTGSDNHGRFSYDDSDCTFAYRQKWFFKFDASIGAAERPGLMAMAARQVHDGWSGKFKLVPSKIFNFSTCECPQGATVAVSIDTQEGEKQGIGIAVSVTPKVRANVNPVTGSTELEHNAKSSDFRGTKYDTGLQYTVAHEFGHTIDLTDEYVGWTAFFVPGIAADVGSQLNAGNDVRPRHYQYFGDLLSRAVLGCRFSPDGIREPDRERAVFSRETLSGITIQQDGLEFKGAEKVDPMGQFLDFRLSNTRLLGIFYPQLGAVKFTNSSPAGKDEFGLTAGLRLSQIAYPFEFNVRTGVAVSLLDPSRRVTVPISFQAGLHTDRFEAGVHVTPLIDVTNFGGVQLFTGLGFRATF